MMSAQIIYRGRTIKQVEVTGIDNDTREAIVDIAMRRAGETRTSLFGWNVAMFNDDTAAIVSLHTD